MAMDGPPFDATSDGIRLRVRLTPRGGREAVDGLRQLPDGRWVVALRVMAPPVEGAANDAVVAFVAKALGLPKSRLTIAAGQSSRLKSIQIEGEPGDLAARVTAWVGR